jgi:heptosyltransferase-2
LLTCNPRALKNIESEKIQRVVIRTANWLGDAVMTLPAMIAVRAAYPAAHIAVVANPLVAQLLENHPSCDEIIVFNKRGEHAGLLGFLRFVISLRRGKFDLAILFQSAIEAAVMSFLARIPRRLGFTTDNRRFLLTHPVPFGEAEKKLHQVDAFLRIPGYYNIKAKDKVQALALSESERAWAKEQLPAGSVVVINPGAAYGSAKRWYPERFAAVGDFLAKEHGMTAVLIGGPGEVEIGNDIVAAMQSPALNFVGGTSIRQMMSLIDAASLMITNDSGPMHIAAGFNVPIVAVFGSTDHMTTSPFTERYRIVRHEVECSPCLLRECPIDHRCMDRVTVNDVIKAVQSFLQEIV